MHPKDARDVARAECQPARGSGALRPEPSPEATRLAAASGGRDAEFLRRVARVEHAHLAPLRLIEGGAGEVEVVRQWAPEPTLGALLSERGSLSPGEVVTVLVPVARAVAAVHADGLLVGGLSASDVHLDETGRAVLALPRLPSPASTEREAGTLGEPWDDDVRDLARLGWLMVAGSPPRDAESSLVGLVPGAPPVLAGLISAVLDAPAGALPAAAEFATALLAAFPPEPVRSVSPWFQSTPMVAAGEGDVAAPNIDPGKSGEERIRAGDRGGAPRPARRSRSASRRAAPVGRRRRPTRSVRTRVTRRLRVAPAVALALIVVLAAGVAAWTRVDHVESSSRRALPVEDAAPSARPIARAPSAASGPASAFSAKKSSPPAAPPRGAGRDAWPAVLDELDRRRASALEHPETSALGQVYVAGSPAYERDEALVTAYAAHGAHVEGLRAEVVSATRLPAAPDSAGSGAAQAASSGDAGVVRLLVHDRMSAYDVVTKEGATAHHPRRGVRVWHVELHRVAAGQWRIWDLQPVHNGGAA